MNIEVDEGTLFLFEIFSYSWDLIQINIFFLFSQFFGVWKESDYAKLVVFAILIVDSLVFDVFCQRFNSGAKKF
jgi:hypothetical protein